MMRRSRFFLNSFLRLVAAAGLPPGATSGCAFFCCSFATCYSVSFDLLIPELKHFPALALLAGNFLLGRHRAAPRTLAGARVGVRTLATDRQIAPMANSAIRLNFDQPANVHLDLFAEIALDAAFLFNFLAQTVGLVFGKIADFFIEVDARLIGELARAFLPDTI